MAVAVVTRTLVHADNGNRADNDALASSPVPCSPMRWRWQRQRRTLMRVDDSNRAGDDALASSPVPCFPVQWQWQWRWQRWHGRSCASTTVETGSHGTKVPTPCRTLSETPKKEVSWRDSLFPHHLTQPISLKSQSLHRDLCSA